MDLREELKILRDIQIQTHSDQGQLPDVKMIQTVTKMPICSIGCKAIKLSETDQWILDRNYFYALVKDQGLVKLSTGKDASTPG